MKKLVVALFNLLVITSVGCASARYSADSLPAQFAARSQLSAQHFDLSKLPRQSIPDDWLQPGDQVDVSIATGVEVNSPAKWALTVDDRGAIDVPLVGPVLVGGASPNVASARIRDESIRRGVYLDPKVNVAIADKRKITVSVTGAVNKPESVDLPVSNSDLAAALTAAGGIAEDAAPFIEIRHSPATLQAIAQKPATLGPGGVALASFQSQETSQVVRVDLSNIQSYSPQALQLYDGSIVSVMRSARRTVSVTGLVKRPDQIEMPHQDDLTLLDAIAKAGGTTLSIADRVLIVRRVADKPEPVVIKASLRGARSGGPDNLKLAAGDIVNVEETPATMALQTITTFFRVGFTSGLPGI